MKMWLKRGFRKFVINENGAVSIYAIMITLLLFIFNAVLIDYIRIMTAEREADRAAQAAIRSVMSSYDSGVKSYGLFGFDGDADAIFQDAFEKNLDVSDNDIFNFVLLNPVSDSVSTNINGDRMLANSEAITHQILEDMKYVAPIEVGISIIDAFYKWPIRWRMRLHMPR